MKNNVFKKIMISAIIAVMLTICAVALCACDDGANSSDHFASDVHFDVDKSNVTIMGQGSKFLVSKVFDLALDEENTYLVFGKDGKMHFQIRTKAGLFGVIPTLLSDLSNLIPDLNLDAEGIGQMLENFDIKGGVDTMVEPMFPGFKSKLEAGDLDGALKLIQRSLGFYLYGLDYENDDVKEILNYVGKYMKLPKNLLEKIPADTQLTLTFDCDYHIKDVVGQDGTPYRAIYVGSIGAENQDTQPFGIFNVTKTDKDKMAIELKVEFMAVKLGFVER